MADSLSEIRRKIDALDARLVQLLSARARQAQNAWQAKGGTAAYKPEREAQILRRARELNKGPLSGAALSRLFTEIMSVCRALEEQMAVAYLGPEGTFSQEAVIKHFGSATGSQPHVSIDEVFRAVETGAAGYGVVPVENSTEGAVGRTLDLLLNTQARICGEVMLPVRQCLMSTVRRRDAIRTVYSHTQSLAQCQQWLSRNLPQAERVAVVSNAEAARLALPAGVARVMCGELLGVERLGTGVAVSADRVLTAHYLVMGASTLEVEGFDGLPRTVRRTIIDHESGFALLILDGPPLRPARTTEDPRPGLPVFLMSCTAERERKGTTGHVTRIGPFEAFWEYMLDRAIITTAINPGLAGAPLFDPSGALLGLVSLGMTTVGRYSLAIPIDLYLARREAMDEGAPGPGSASIPRASTAGWWSPAWWRTARRKQQACRPAISCSRWRASASPPCASCTAPSGRRSRATPCACRSCATPPSGPSR